MTVALKERRTNVTADANTMNGDVIQGRLMPQLRMAVISLLRDRRPRVRSVAISTAKGAI